MAFSGALTLTDLNDFITPSQACIKPVEQSNSIKERDPGAASTEIHIDSDGTYYEIAANVPTQSVVAASPAKKLEQAQISLNDCLACSGCITSAESVLITLQSHTEVLNFLEANGNSSSPKYKIPVISLSPQSLASLAASLLSTSSVSVTPHQILRRVQAFCTQSLGFAHAYDITFARHLALQEHVMEFLERKTKDVAGGEDAIGQLPMLSSACPGWVCYAEKAHSEMLPFISRTKSPQQVMGTMVKEWMASKWGKTPEEVYHVSVMPCYDKKLEASRQDFYNEIYSTRDVDCVITTGELELLMRERGWDLSIAAPGDANIKSEGEIPELVQHPGSSSGSYLQSIVSHIQETSKVPLVLSVKTIRNADYEEVTLTEEGTNGIHGKVVFKGAKCYGFRNLQNVVRKIGKERGVRVGKGAAGKMVGRAIMGRRTKKTGADDMETTRVYDYVEVMACPSGCVNGGGQLKPVPEFTQFRDEEGYQRDWEETGAKWGDKNWTKKVEEVYWWNPYKPLHDLPTPPPSPPKNLTLDKTSMCPIDTGSDFCGHNQRMIHLEDMTGRIREYFSARPGKSNSFRTQYRAVESEVVGLAVKW